MYDAIPIANLFVERSIKEDNPITNMKLQKLIYIANGVNLAINNEPLIIERIAVWTYGPVVSSVYHTFKGFGNTKIEYPALVLNKPNLDDEAKKSITDAWEIAGHVSATQLSNWTHNANSPWTRAKKESLDFIPDEYMQDFFKGFLVG